jgi:hypothetical protein
MLFHAYEIDNRAVWNAMQQHVRLLIQSGEDITFIVHIKNVALVQQQFPMNAIITYNHYFNFIKAIINNNEKEIFCPSFIDVIMVLPIRLFKKFAIYYWNQGIAPEESYMRHKSKLRKYLLSSAEYLALKFSSTQILVSTEMKRFLEAKYSLKLHSIIIPCSSDLTYQNIEKIKDSYVYVGGMSVWQRFDTIIKMFNIIVHSTPNAMLYIATGDLDIAKQIIRTHIDTQFQDRISLQSINDRSTMETFLNTMQYGFLIRDDDPVNNVASPIKLAEYLSCGVNVIISNALTSYAPLVEQYGAGISVKTLKDIEKLKTFSYSVENSLRLYQDYFSEANLLDTYKTIL